MCYNIFEVIKLSLLGENIKNIRKSGEISRKDLSLELGISVHTLSKYEQGQREPNILMLNKISEALEVSIDNIIGNNLIAFIDSPTKKKSFLNENDGKTILLSKNNGDISESDALIGITKYINNIANSENYIIGSSECAGIIKSADELIRGKILIIKSRRKEEIISNNE